MDKKQNANEPKYVRRKRNIKLSESSFCESSSSESDSDIDKEQFTNNSIITNNDSVGTQNES